MVKIDLFHSRYLKKKLVGILFLLFIYGCSDAVNNKTFPSDYESSYFLFGVSVKKLNECIYAANAGAGSNIEEFEGWQNCAEILTSGFVFLACDNQTLMKKPPAGFPSEFKIEPRELNELFNALIKNESIDYQLDEWKRHLPVLNYKKKGEVIVYSTDCDQPRLAG